MKLYLAGGWFSPQQEEEHTRIYNLLKNNFEKTHLIFNPRLNESSKNNSGPYDKMTQVFLDDIHALDDCDVVVVLTDYKDMGTLFEAGYAYKSQIPIVYYAETLGEKGFNLMLAKTGYVATNENELIAILKNHKCYKFREINDSYKGVIE